MNKQQQILVIIQKLMSEQAKISWNFYTGLTSEQEMKDAMAVIAAGAALRIMELDVVV